MTPVEIKAIRSAIYSGNLERLRQLLQSKTAREAVIVGKSWLHVAASKGQVEIVDWLVSAGLAIDAVDSLDFTPLCHAASGGHCEAVARLLDLGAKMETKNSIRHPLYAVAHGDHVDIARLLVERGIDVNARQSRQRGGTTNPYEFAVERRAQKVAEFLRPLTSSTDSSGDEVRITGKASPMTIHEGDDAQMVAASQQARDTFRDFFKLIASDFNRLLPALQTAVVKAMFSDSDEAGVEHMWVDEVRFDGVSIHGILRGTPSWLKSVKGGEKVSFKLDQLSDWLIVMGDKVYGGYTIQAIRAKMNERDRANHDQAWGLNFPSPETVLVPGEETYADDMLASVIAEQIDKDPSKLKQSFEGGRTILHQEALYGRAACVKVLLDRGASKEAKCDRGWTALDYAKSLQWGEVIVLLERN